MENKKENKTREILTPINVRIPIGLLNRMTKVRTDEGISVSFQLVKGAEMYLKDKKVKE